MYLDISLNPNGTLRVKAFGNCVPTLCRQAGAVCSGIWVESGARETG